MSPAVRPEAWLSSVPIVGSSHLLLACRVSGFDPKPVWVMWMRGEQEQPGTWQEDVLPSADGTWHLQAVLDVEAEEAADLSCRVRHSSLETRTLFSTGVTWICKCEKVNLEPLRVRQRRVS